MLKKFNFRSKKGMSLAVALTICLFLILVTGGITTVALLQQTETGSNMNTRQAYISAKSGLDTMQDALRKSVIPDDLLPSTGGTYYYVMYYDKDSGQLVVKNYNDEDRAREKVVEFANTGHTIVGGNGTYFKVTNTDGKKNNVTALNTTGKYNNNISMNRGDLSFDMVKVDKYVFKIKEGQIQPPNPPSGNSKFMLVGQQTCLNEFSSDSHPTTTLRDYSRHQEGGSNNLLSGIFYIPSNENGNSHSYAYTYFPVVYDKSVKIETEAGRVSLSAIDEGYYLLGNTAGNLSSQIISENVNPVSYMTQNAAYQQYFGCKFFCIENNFVTVRESGVPKDYSQDPLIKYAGTQYPMDGQAYVVAYVKGTVNFHVANKSRDCIEHFSVSEGYYKINTGPQNTGAVITNPNTWNDPITDPAEIQKWDDFNLYATIKNYMSDGGEIHSGTNETTYSESGSSNVEILDRNGKFNTTQNSDHIGFSKSESWTPTYTERVNHSVFMAPNYCMTQEGYYNWYCGRTLNFQWFRNANTPFTVPKDAHIRMSASAIVLTIGPDVKHYNDPDQYITVSKEIKGVDNASWQLYGTQGPASGEDNTPTLHVMSKFHVIYPGGDYWILPGTYTSITNGLNLFSDDGKDYFDPNGTNGGQNTPETNQVSTASTDNSAVMPASINTQTVRALSLFSRVNNRLALTPMVSGILEIKDNSTHIYSFQVGDPDPFNLNTQFLVDHRISKLLYNDGTDDGKHSIPIASSLTIKMKKSKNESEDIVTFQGKAGQCFEIPAVTGETEFNIYDGKEIKKRAEENPNVNYELVSEDLGQILIIEEYY